jgi:hypothetical protein
MPVDHYATLADVNKLAPQAPFTPTSKPPDADVTTFIGQVAERIDAVLANLGYVVPVVTGAKSLTLLRELNAWGAMGQAHQARMTLVAPDAVLQRSPWTKLFDDWIARISDPSDPFELPDAPRTTGELVKPLGELLRSTANLSDDVYDPEARPFRMDMKF